MKLKTILTLLAALGILTACNDDFFDQVPDDRITIEQVFQRTSYSEKYLATVYSYIRDESHRTNGVPWDPCSDDLDVTYDREDYNSFKMNLGNWSASSNYYEYWSHYYRGIRSATYFIQHIGSNQEMLDDPTRGPIVVEQYKNEARFLRAWFYYCLLRQYGPCVLLGDEVLPGDLDRDDVKMNLPRSSYDECVDYIVGELDDMIDNNRLPLHFTVQADKDYGRATLAMCMGLKSRVLLLAASDQFNGNPAYANVVNTDGKHLFSTRKDPEKWNKAAQAAKDVIDLGIFDLYKEYHTDGTLDPYLSCRNVFLENWNSEVMMVRISNYLKHWERSASPRQRPFVIMRYAEILLNYVEALNEYDPGNADIETYLNKIRERGGLGPVQSDLNQSQMREQIRLERRIELCFEQLRYFDTRRWLIADQTDGGPFYGMNVDAGNSFTDEAFYEKTVFETRVFRPEFYLFPIPQSEINRDPQIVQNPGW